MLPIRKVVLYKHGLGYFERHGQVAAGEAAIELQFKASEMNDVLKSLTAVGGVGTITSVSYESSEPLDQALADIPLKLTGGEHALSGLLEQVRGAKLTVTAGRETLEGTLLGVEHFERPAGDGSIQSAHLSLLLDEGAIRTVELAETRAVKFCDESLERDVRHILDLLISGKKKDQKRLTLFTQSAEAQPIAVGYIAESPVWKTSYRLLLGTGADEASHVQGWALIDNTQDDDWEDVQLSLVAGLPVSFIHDLHSPRHRRRPVVAIDEGEAYGPPTVEAAAFDQEMDAAPQMAEAAAPMPRRRSKKLGSITAGAVARGGGGFGAEAMSADKLREEFAASTNAKTSEIGDLFCYDVDAPVTVRRNQSALVPILASDFEGERVLIYNPEVREQNPMSAVRFRNTTGLTLEGGPATVLEQGAYVGETMLETVKPDEQQILPYSVELSCSVTLDHDSSLQEVHDVRIVHGSLHFVRYRLDRKTYLFGNRADREFEVFLDHRFQHGWELHDSPEPAERTANFYRFRFKLPADQTTRFTVIERGSETESYGLYGVNSQQITVWIQQKVLSAETRTFLEAIATVNAECAHITEEIARRDQSIAEIFENQSRLRENLGALGTTPDEKGLRDRYVAALGAEEDRLATLRDELAQLRQREAELQADLRQRIDG